MIPFDICIPPVYIEYYNTKGDFVSIKRITDSSFSCIYATHNRIAKMNLLFCENESIKLLLLFYLIYNIDTRITNVESF